MTVTPFWLAHSLVHTSLPSLTLHGTGETLRPGSSFSVNAALTEAARDITGFSWVDLIDDEPGQLALWGAVRFRRGPAPAHLMGPERGSVEWSDAREIARQAAHRIDDEDEKQAALKRVRDTYGPLPTSKTLSTFRP
jgi:hypothetical protein